MFCTLFQVIPLGVCSVYIALLSLKFLGIQKTEKLCVMLLDILHSFTINSCDKSYFERTSQKKDQGKVGNQS